MDENTYRPRFDNLKIALKAVVDEDSVDSLNIQIRFKTRMTSHDPEHATKQKWARAFSTLRDAIEAVLKPSIFEAVMDALKALMIKPEKPEPAPQPAPQRSWGGPSGP